MDFEKFTTIKKGDLICSIDDLIDNKAIVRTEKNKYLPGLIIFKNKDIIKIWINDCPHANLSLDLIKGKVQSSDGKLLCANHGAKFDPETHCSTHRLTDRPTNGRPDRPTN